MHHQLHKYLAFFLILFSALEATSQQKSYTFKGEAKNKKGEVVYIEQIHVTENANGLTDKVETDYQRPTGEVFAKMRAVFGSQESIPNIDFEDFRFQQNQMLKLNAETNKVEIQIEDKKSSKMKTGSLEVKQDMIAGPGFHNFIVKNFESFKSKDSFSIHFVVLAKKDYFKFDVLRKNQNGKTTEFKMRIHSWILRGLVSPIYVEYDNVTKRLLSYKGLTNIPTDSDSPQELTITYKY